MTIHKSMPLGARIFIAGHRGLVGSAIFRRLKALGYSQLLTESRTSLDLTNSVAVEAWFRANKPEYVFLAAAKVGGINANRDYPADFIYTNVLIQTHVIHSSYRFGVKKLIFLGSSCIYPKITEQPIKEDALLTGLLEPSNDAYAIAKICGIKMCSAYCRQYGVNFLSVMPTNVYGPGDNYCLSSSHVVPALIRKIFCAVQDGAKTVEIWGSGRPRREFIHSDDLADACVFLMRYVDVKHIANCINIGWGKDIAIAELAEIIGEIAGYQGTFIYNQQMPDGVLSKKLDTGQLSNLGWQPKITLRKGLEATYRHFLAFDRHRYAIAGMEQEIDSST